MRASGGHDSSFPVARQLAIMDRYKAHRAHNPGSLIVKLCGLHGG